MAADLGPVLALLTFEVIVTHRRYLIVEKSGKSNHYKVYPETKINEQEMI